MAQIAQILAQEIFESRTSSISATTNSWAAPNRPGVFPDPGNLRSVQALDLLDNGTA